MRVLIVEGVTGAGKTSTINALQSITSFELIDENATFGDFMTEFVANADTAAYRAQDRMTRILDQIEGADTSRRYLLERFHFSQLALGSTWDWYRGIDDRCAALGCKVVALVLPVERLGLRSLYRAEYGGKDWQNFIVRYGSEEAALEAIRQSQHRRIAAINQSHLEHRMIDTTEMAWDRYAVEIAGWVG